MFLDAVEEPVDLPGRQKGAHLPFRTMLAPGKVLHPEHYQPLALTGSDDPRRQLACQLLMQIAQFLPRLLVFPMKPPAFCNLPFFMDGSSLFYGRIVHAVWKTT